MVVVFWNLIAAFAILQQMARCLAPACAGRCHAAFIFYISPMLRSCAAPVQLDQLMERRDTIYDICETAL